MNTCALTYQTYIDILQEELMLAMGCIEPIAVAYAGALMRKILGAVPEKIELIVSGNIGNRGAVITSADNIVYH